jgi:hypothetical protein
MVTTYKLRCSIISEIHSSLFLLLHLVSNYVLGVGRAQVVVGSALLGLGFKPPFGYLGFHVLH